MIKSTQIRSLFFVFATVLMSSTQFSAQSVEVLMDKEVITDGMKTEFTVRCAAEYAVEIVVFSGDHLALHQKSTLVAGDSKYELQTAELPEGKYFILITGENIHVEKEFFVAKKG